MQNTQTITLNWNNLVVTDGAIVSVDTARDFAAAIDHTGCAYLSLDNDGTAYAVCGESNGVREPVQEWTREELRRFFEACEGEPTDADYAAFASYLQEQIAEGVVAN